MPSKWSQRRRRWPRSVTTRPGSAHPEGLEGDQGPNGEGKDIRADAEAGQEPRILVKLKSITDLPQHLARSIAQIEFEDGVPVKIKFHDKIRALQLLGMAYRLFDGNHAVDDQAEHWTGFVIIAPTPKEDREA